MSTASQLRVGFAAALVVLCATAYGRTATWQQPRNGQSPDSTLNWALHFSQPSDSVAIDGTTEIEDDMTIEAIVAFDRTGTRDGLFIEDWFNEGSIGQKNFGASPSGLHGYVFPRDSKIGYLRVQKELALNRWHHVAFVVDGKKVQGVDDEGLPATFTKQRMYLNGRLVAERETSTEQISETTTSCLLGLGWTGYLSSFRISRVARYEDEFYEPTYTKLPTDEDTLLLYNFSKDPGNGLIEDESGNNRTGRLGVVGPRTPKPTSPAYVLYGPDLSIDTDRDGVTDYRESIDETDHENPKSFDSTSRRLVAHYSLNQSLVDTTGFGRTGRIASGDGNVTYAEGVLEAALTLKGDSTISLPANYGAISGGTIAFWIRRSQNPFVYVQLEDGKQRGLSFGWGWREGSDEAGFWVKKRGARATWQGPYFTEALDMPRNLWTHVALVVDRNGRLTTYLNGLRTGSYRIKGGVPWSANPRQTSLVFVGDGSSSPELARLDDIRVYRRLLTPSEVSGLFASANPDKDSDGLLDRHETNTGVYVSPTNTGTDPRRADSNGDAIPDGQAVRSQLNPFLDCSNIVQFIKKEHARFNLWTESQYEDSRSLGQEEGRRSVVDFPARNGFLRIADLPKLPNLEIEMPVSTPFRIMLAGEEWTRHGLSLDPLLSEGPPGSVAGNIPNSSAVTARMIAYKGSSSTQTYVVAIGPPGSIETAAAPRSAITAEPGGSENRSITPASSSPSAGADANKDGIPDLVATALGFDPALKLSGVVSYVKSNPRLFGLRNNEDYRDRLLSGRAEGKAAVLESPRAYGLIPTSEKPIQAELRLEVPPMTPISIRTRGWASVSVNNHPTWSASNNGDTTEVLGFSHSSDQRRVRFTGSDLSKQRRSPMVINILPTSF